MVSGKKATLLLVAFATALLAGCASYQRDSHGFDARAVDSVIKLHETTVEQVRALMGTPTVDGVTESDSSRVLGYALVGENAGKSFLKNFGKGFITLGLGSSSNEYTNKNIYFKFDDQGRLTDMKKKGYGYVTRHRLTFWNECEFDLTEEEINSSAHYEGKEVCARYAQEIAQKEGITVDQVDTGREFPFCNIPCHAVRGAEALFGKFKTINDNVDELPGDGSRADELYGADRLIK